MDIAELKQSLRKSLKTFRKSIGAEKVEQVSNQAIQNCLRAIDWKKVKNVHIYIPITNLKEINTWPLLKHLWVQHPGLNIFVPVIRNDRIYSTKIDQHTVLQPAKFGTIEPLHPTLLPGNQTFDVVIVPTLGFDRKGQRLGYGKGFYDHFLSKHKAKTIGLAYAKSEVGSGIPKESHDVALDFIATERELIATA